ncbi:MAG: leucine-rich repeat domain-containing protein [SAR324 cluster bacterium]|nr:leucine-rich repeat domain-containing protein [SAR324 cluster bacterium]MCZ6533404.1 leucine-rich repeat domain-containing protein [SAR324 cluster bacterium]MCZ6558518.1 leucine-rich repeat domain-containing protein [SAR324 cluster bacterium]MCZ6629413.1 leucine-rich repeat domain-containing protein [SAR324 cluster bacterium]MCZ6644624.1 leucine-rich repeat domain-containing protein [SAR324 cluster bacterium]
MRRLVLNQNRITDLSPLADSENLHELSLDGNRVADLSPLASLTQLERLALAGNPLNPEALAVLSTMGNSLTYLNLRATTFTQQEVA